MSQPWLTEAVGTAEWTGTPLAPILEEAGKANAVRTVVFTGLDRGVQGGIEQAYERSLSYAEATHPDVLLAYEMNGSPLAPQHGHPLRLIVPGWYGMAHVKWLGSITLLSEDFTGYQQAAAYHHRVEADDPGVPVTKILPRALMVPPGIPDFMTRTRFVQPSRQLIEGRAWSGRARIAGVDFSADGGKTWTKATVEPSPSPYAWSRWWCEWDASRPGSYELCARATDAAGNQQPTGQSWSLEGVQNNAVQRVQVIVGEALPRQAPAGSH
jgi:DMSO/TMAO reductase YedYZ molybdopterin-dependent catalytic subunit